MATPLVDLGTGTTVTFGTSGFTAELTDIQISNLSREVIETSNLATAQAGAGQIGSKTFLAGDLTDPGSVTLTGHFNPDTVPPLEGDAETVTITFPPNSGVITPASWAFSGQVISYDPSIPLEDKMTFTMEVKAVGPITVTAGV